MEGSKSGGSRWRANLPALWSVLEKPKDGWAIRRDRHAVHMFHCHNRSRSLVWEAKILKRVDKEKRKKRRSLVDQGTGSQKLLRISSLCVHRYSTRR